MEKEYKNWLKINMPTSAETYFKEIKKLENKLKIENIFSIDEKTFEEYFTERVISSLDKNTKSYLNKFIEFKNFTKKNIKSIKRNKTEFEAILFVTEYFEKSNYQIKSVQKDNLGFDLIANKNKESLTLEVKGLAGKSSNIIISSNEIEYLDKNFENHRICVVRNCDKKSKELIIFKFEQSSKQWKTEDKKSVMKFDKHLSSQYKII